ncbi:MAG: bifunctional phosphopantothenoylcysteine decarboxylase/phosphopantothenate--cysteine ligase CoaBC [Eubacterium sp.]|nr:bifunctional phosphopantothenoylcysteine decarboxylase/phosphopantothenate--cysteine ligase CoaBC [Eubacterium sp.]
MLKGKTIVLGVTGGIAAYKAAELSSLLVKQHAEVHVIMTENAANFIHPLTFETLTKQKCLTDTFDRNHPFEVTHVELAKKADLVLVAPATANIAAKLAHGLCDDMLTTTVLACTCPKLIAPAMNTRMYENPVTQNNLRLLKQYGWTVIEPASGLLACGDTGSGKFPDPSDILPYVLRTAAFEQDLSGLKILVTAGPTQEAIDPVRYITNHSSGKMGYAIAKIAALRGADVTLVTGKTALNPPAFTTVVPIQSAEDLFREVTSRSEAQDIIIKAAAVADYAPAEVSDEKVKKRDDDLSIALKRTPDTLQYLVDHQHPWQLLCGFAMETSDLEERARGKLKKKNLDLIAGNNVKVKGAGFGTDTNVVTLVTADRTEQLSLMSKEDVAARILDQLLRIRNSGSLS